MSKASFRKVMRDKTILNRLECHIVFRMLEDNGNVRSDLLSELLSQPLPLVEGWLQKRQRKPKAE